MAKKLTVAECKQCKRYRSRLENIARLTRQCNKDYAADMDTTDAYEELRKEGERIDRMMQRVWARERRAAEKVEPTKPRRDVRAIIDEVVEQMEESRG